MSYIKYLVSLLLTLLIVPHVAGQYPLVRNFGPSDYNGDTQNWDFAESKLNYIFVANGAGLMVFGGTEWDKVNMPNLTGVRCVTTSEEGDRFYVGAFDEFGYFENRAPLSEAPYISLAKALPEKERNFTWIWSIEKMPDGRIVFHSTDRIFTYSPDSRKLHVYHIRGKISDVSLIGGTLYISADSGIYKMTSGAPEVIHNSSSLGSSYVIGVFENNGVPVFCTRKKGMYILTPEGKGVPYEMPGFSDAISGRHLSCVASAGDLLALGTSSEGIFIFDRKEKTVRHIDKRTGLRNNSVNNILIDGDANIWVALGNGVSYVILDSPFQTLLTSGDEIGTGYASLPHGDNLYLGTDQGLYKISRPRSGNPRPSYPEKIEGIGGQIWSLAEFGDVVLCGANEGTYIVDGGRARHLGTAGASWGFRKYPGREDCVISSNYDGFSILSVSGGDARAVCHIEGTSEGTANFEVDADGALWYTHWLKGVYRITLSKDLKKVLWVHRFDHANQLPSDENNLVVKIGGKVYISSLTGFYRYNTHSKKLEKADWLDKLFYRKNSVTRVIETPGGDLWAYRPDCLMYATRKGEEKYDVKPLHYSSTVKSLQMNLGNISFLSPTATIMNQNDGFFVVRPDLKSVAQRNVMIDFVRRIPKDENGDNVYYFRGFKDESGFEVNEKDASLYFSFSISQYRDLAPVKFSTYIEGYDTDWTQFSTQNYREISGIPPGKYKIKVRALDAISSGIPEMTLPFRVIAPWYKTWWAITLFILIAMIAFNLVIEGVKRNVIRIMEQRKLAEERKRAEEEQREMLIERNASISEDNERLSKEIKKKSGELVGTDLRRMQKSDILREVSERLRELSKSSPDTPASALISSLRSLLRTLNAHEVAGEGGVDIEENINILFDDQLSRLAEKYPKLTRNDLRMCSYLKLNLSSKEISNLMNISERSVESNRYRLRKKLGMPTGQSFREFFMIFDKEENSDNKMIR